MVKAVRLLKICAGSGFWDYVLIVRETALSERKTGDIASSTGRAVVVVLWPEFDLDEAKRRSKADIFPVQYFLC